jgi:signal transduction histidine kinase
MKNFNENNIMDALAIIAHEIRRPVDIISKSAELVSRSQEKGSLEADKLYEIMEGIISGCHRMNHLTSQIICLAQVENDKLKIIIEKNNVEQFVRSIEKYLTPFVSRFNIKFTFEYNFKDPYAICDFKKLEIILLNLISNAVKYSKKSNRRITIKAFDSDDGKTIHFSVKDRGIGINPCELEKIFDKFYRIESFSTRQTEGCGLGLALVKSLVNFLGGTILIESEEDKGSEFTVIIPRTQKNDGEPSKIVETVMKYKLYASSIDEIFADINEPD